MELKDQVCTFEQAKKFEALGIKQKSIFFWMEVLGQAAVQARPIDDLFKRSALAGGAKFYSAFTLSELGQMLPRRTYTQRTSLEEKEDINAKPGLSNIKKELAYLVETLEEKDELGEYVYKLELMSIFRMSIILGAIEKAQQKRAEQMRESKDVIFITEAATELIGIAVTKNKIMSLSF